MFSFAGVGPGDEALPTRFGGSNVEWPTRGEMRMIFEQVATGGLYGGMAAWREAGYPLEN